MLKNSKAFSTFAVRDLGATRKFYTQVLGIDVTDVPGMEGLLELKLGSGTKVTVYSKPDHTPATFTVLNFPVDDIERTVNALVERGVRFEIYKEGPVKTDSRGIAAGEHGPKIAWFKDPSGNILSVLQER